MTKGVARSVAGAAFAAHDALQSVPRVVHKFDALRHSRHKLLVVFAYGTVSHLLAACSHYRVVRVVSLQFVLVVQHVCASCCVC